VAERLVYRPSFSADATEFILSLKKRRQRATMDRIYQLSRFPFITSDYIIDDADGRPIEHILENGIVFSYWVDHAERIIMITDLEEVG
jgi:hypothetical protein